ncbi:MAG: hypothetical protein ACJ8AT_27755 [Hyalangium sp.]
MALSMGGVLTAGLLVWTTAGAAKGQDIFLHTPGEAISATVKGDSVASPDVQLYRSSDAVRGRAFGRVVNLDIEGDQVAGIVGDQPTRLRLNPQAGGGLEAVGMLGGGLSRFKLTPKEFSGTVAACSYELRFTGTRYEGSRACRGKIEAPVYLELPPTLAEGGDAQAVATLGLILGTP